MPSTLACYSAGGCQRIGSPTRVNALKAVRWHFASACFLSSLFATARKKFVKSAAALFRSERLRLAGVLLCGVRMERRPLARMPQCA